MNIYKTKVMFLVFISTICISLLSAQDQEVVIGIDKLSDEVYMLTGQGGNIGIYIGQKNVFMIDDQFDRLSDKIKAALNRLQISPLHFSLIHICTVTIPEVMQILIQTLPLW